MVNILNPYNFLLLDFRQKLSLLNQSTDSILISKNNIEPENLSQITEILDSEKLLWFSSSGTYNKKLIGLSTKALFNSANSVNDWLELSPIDNWAIALPLQHIASVAVLFRSLLSECKIKLFEDNWDAVKFCSFLQTNNISICSLVPTQIYDLVENQLKPAKKLRAVLVGGARLDENLYCKARQLGWPVLPTYGLTECASQVACAPMDSLESEIQFPDLLTLPHLEVSTSEDQRLIITGSSLLTKSIIFGSTEGLQIKDYTQENRFVSSDLGSVEDRVITITGRADRNVKIKGSFVQLQNYEELCYKFFHAKLPEYAGTLIATSFNDLRDGFKIALCIHGNKIVQSLQQLMQELNTFLAQQSPDLAKIEYILELAHLPILDNHKINYNEVDKIAQQLISNG